MVIDDDPDVGPLLPNFRDLGSIGFPRHRPVAAFVMADVMIADAAWHQVKLTLVPNPFPAVEEVDDQAMPPRVLPWAVNPIFSR